MSRPGIRPASSIAALAVRSRSLLPGRSTSGENSSAYSKHPPYTRCLRCLHWNGATLSARSKRCQHRCDRSPHPRPPIIAATPTTRVRAAMQLLWRAAMQLLGEGGKAALSRRLTAPAPRLVRPGVWHQAAPSRHRAAIPARSADGLCGERGQPARWSGATDPDSLRLIASEVSHAVRSRMRISCAEWTDRSAPLGRYWRSRPLVFSFDPRCQGLCGSQK